MGRTGKSPQEGHLLIIWALILLTGLAQVAHTTTTTTGADPDSSTTDYQETGTQATSLTMSEPSTEASTNGGQVLTTTQDTDTAEQQSTADSSTDNESVVTSAVTTEQQSLTGTSADEQSEVTSVVTTEQLATGTSTDKPSEVTSVVTTEQLATGTSTDKQSEVTSEVTSPTKDPTTVTTEETSTTSVVEIVTTTETAPTEAMTEQQSTVDTSTAEQPQVTSEVTSPAEDSTTVTTEETSTTSVVESMPTTETATTEEMTTTESLTTEELTTSEPTTEAPPDSTDVETTSKDTASSAATVTVVSDSDITSSDGTDIASSSADVTDSTSVTSARSVAKTSGTSTFDDITTSSVGESETTPVSTVTDNQTTIDVTHSTALILPDDSTTSVAISNQTVETTMSHSTSVVPASVSTTPVNISGDSTFSTVDGSSTALLTTATSTEGVGATSKATSMTSTNTTSDSTTSVANSSQTVVATTTHEYTASPVPDSTITTPGNSSADITIFLTDDNSTTVQTTTEATSMASTGNTTSTEETDAVYPESSSSYSDVDSMTETSPYTNTTQIVSSTSSEEPVTSTVPGTVTSTGHVTSTEVTTTNSSSASTLTTTASSESATSATESTTSDNTTSVANSDQTVVATTTHEYTASPVPDSTITTPANSSADSTVSLTDESSTTVQTTATSEDIVNTTTEATSMASTGNTTSTEQTDVVYPESSSSYSDVDSMTETSPYTNTTQIVSSTSAEEPVTSTVPGTVTSTGHVTSTEVTTTNSSSAPTLTTTASSESATSATESTDSSTLQSTSDSSTTEASANEGPDYEVGNLTVIPLSSSSLLVNWTDAANNSAYEVTWDLLGAGDPQSNITLTNEYIITELQAGSKYSIGVFACRDEKCSSKSEEAATLATTLPNTPQNVHAEVINISMIRIVWDFEGKVDVFQLKVQPQNLSSNIPSDPGETVIAGDKCEGHFKDPTPGENYTVTVIAIVNGVGSESEPATFQSFLAPVTNLSVEPRPGGELVVSWNHAEGLKDNYSVTCMEQGDSPLPSATLETTNNSATCKGLTPGGLYEIQVITQQDGNTMDDCSTCSILGMTMPDPPGNIAAVALSATSINVSWTKPENFVTEYNVSYHPVGNPDLKSEKSTTDTSIEIDSLIADEMYNITVQSFHKYEDEGLEAYSVEQVSTVVTYAGEITALNITPSTDDLALTWSRPTSTSTKPTLSAYVIFLFTDAECIHRYILSKDGSVEPGDESACTETTKDSITSLDDVNYSVPVTPCTEYNITTAVINDAGTSAGSGITSTESLVADPRSPVIISDISDVSSESMTLTWEQPSDPEQCPIISYTIQYYYTNCSNDTTIETRKIENITQTNYVVDGLPYAYWNYTFVITAFTQEDGSPGASASDNKTTMTAEAAPGAPEITGATATAADKAVITWDPPHFCDQNGVIRSYELSYSCAPTEDPESVVFMGNKSYDGDVRNATIDVKPYRTCTVKLAANTTEPGMHAEQTFNTSIAAPGIVNDSTISSNSTSYSVDLAWEEPERNGPTISYVIRWREVTDSALTEDEWTGEETDATTFTATNLYSYTVYSFEITAKTGNLTGEPSADFQAKTDPGAPYAVKSLYVTPGQRDVSVGWELPERETGPTNYTILVQEVKSPHREFNQTVEEYSSTFGIVDNLIPYWEYHVTVNTTVDGFPAKQSDGESFTTQQDAPPPVEHFNVEKAGNFCRTYTAYWYALLDAKRNGLITSYTVEAVNTSNMETVEDGSITVSVTEEEQSIANYNVTLKVPPETDLIFQIRAETEGGGYGHWIQNGSSNSGSCPPPSAPNDWFGTAVTQENIDNTRQIPIQFDGSFFQDESEGEINMVGFIVSSASEASDGPDKLPLVDFLVKYQRKWKDVQKMDKAKPYRATADGWDPLTVPVAGSIQKRDVPTNRPVTVLVGEQGDCTGHTNTFCNGYLKPGHEYRVKIFACTEDYCTESKYSPTVETGKGRGGEDNGISKSAGSTLTIILVAVLVPVAVILILVGAVIYKKRFAIKPARPAGAHREPAGQVNIGMDLSETQPRPVLLTDFPAHVVSLHRDTDLLFSEEYRLLKDMSPQLPLTAAEMPENRTKNRFTNILSFDHSRVKLLPLEDDESSDYINANYMPGYNSRREFVAAQGPLPATKDDLWRMVWEQNVRVIVMLTNCVERGRTKCDQYWPPDPEPIYYGDLHVQVKSESAMDNYTIRIIEIQLGDKLRTIKQMHFTTWPDHGCPRSTDHLLTFIQRVREHAPRGGTTGPILVHCSAGVGRTGTFICVDRLLQHIRDHPEIDIFATVLEMRSYRVNMVQTEDQYIYIHDCIAEALQRGWHQTNQVNGTVIHREQLPETGETETHLYEPIDFTTVPTITGNEKIQDDMV